MILNVLCSSIINKHYTRIKMIIFFDFKKKILKKIFTVMIFLLTSFNIFAEEINIKIATVGPMSGQHAFFGEQMKAGAKMAINDINSDGGINGIKLELIVRDDACDEKQAVLVAKELAEQSVSFVVGHFCSGSSIAASSVYNRMGIIQISPASTSPTLTEQRPGPYTFRVCGREDQQGKVAAEYLFNKYKNKNIAIIYDSSIYGKKLALSTKNYFESFGGIILIYEDYAYEDNDHSNLVLKLKENNVDALYLGGYQIDASKIIKLIRNEGMETQIISGDTLYNLQYTQDKGKDLEGTIITFSPDPSKYFFNKKLVQKFKDIGVNTEGYVFYTYAAIQAWAQASKISASKKNESILNILNSKSFNTVLGNIEFDDKGDVNLPGYVLYKLNDGFFEYL